MKAVPFRVAMVTILAAANALAQSTVRAKTAKLKQFRGMLSCFPVSGVIREDLNARVRKVEHHENKCYESALYRWNAIAALAECLYPRKSALPVADL